MYTQLLASRLSQGLESLHDLNSSLPTTNAPDLLARLSGEFAAPIARIFPDEWAWVALATPLPKRQIWYAVLSGLGEEPHNPKALRTNLLMTDEKRLMRLRFQALGDPMHGIINRLFPMPLRRANYAELAERLAKDSSLIAWYAGQTGQVDNMELSEILTS